MISIKWKIKEHKELNEGFRMLKINNRHSYMKDILFRDYRKNMYKIWKDLPQKILNFEGIKISEKISAEVFREIFIEKIYFVNGFLPNENDVVIDIGAYYGDSALWWAKKFGAKVYAFEPLPDVYEILVENIKLNNLENKIIPFNFAIGNSNSLDFSIDHDMMTKSKNGLRIKPKKLDEFQFEKVDFIKIDVEGFEKEVLEGAKNTIEKYNPKIILEVHSRDLMNECIDYLKNFNYNVKYYGRKTKNEKMNLVQNLFLEKISN
ncbi:MAG: FkbM family methyltransferase [Thermoplasmata archaeon]